MTLIVAVSDSTGTWLASDSRVSGDDIHMGSIKKLIRYSNDLYVGFAGDIRNLNLLTHAFKPPKMPKTLDPEKYLVTKFIPSLKKVLDLHGRMKSSGGEESDTESWNGELIIIIGSSIFRLMRDFAIVKMDGHAALGQAEDFANALIILGKTVKMEGEELCKMVIAQSSKVFILCDNSIQIIKVR